MNRENGVNHFCDNDLEGAKIVGEIILWWNGERAGCVNWEAGKTVAPFSLYSGTGSYEPRKWSLLWE